MSDRDPSKASESIQRSLANRETIAPSGLEDSTPTGSGPFSALPSQFGRYRVTKLLGRGAMGTVYLAHDPDLGKDVALKVPKFSGDEDPVLLERFRREARAAGDLNHANICGVYEVGQIDTTHFTSMEYIDGRPLSDYISPDLPPRKIAILVRRLVLALAQAHDRGIVHRDLKPANIMVNLQGEPVIMDFGLARRLEASGDVRATQSGMIVGSPAYMSPEQARGENDQIGPWTDIYGLGTLLFELLTGSLPFRGPMLSVLGQIVTQPPPKPSSLRADVDPRLESLCLKMLEKKPQNRPASMTEVAGTLTEWLKPATTKSEPAIALVEEPVALVPTKPAAPRAEKADGIEAQKQRVTDLLDKHQYGPALELLEKMTNLRDARFEKLVAWAKPKLKEVRATEQNLREASAPMCDTAQQLLKHYDYTGAAELLAQVPPAYRSIELRDLLEKVTDLRDECDHLQRDIEDAVRTGDTDTLPALVKRLYKLRPNNKAIKQLYADLKQYGAAKVIARRKGQRRFLDPAGRIVEPQHIAIGIVLVVGLFAGVSLMAWSYLYSKKTPPPTTPVPTKTDSPKPGSDDGSSDKRNDNVESLLNGDTLAGWTSFRTGETHDTHTAMGNFGWFARNGELHCDRDTHGWLRFDRQLTDFELEFDFILAPKGRAIVLLRFPGEGSFNTQTTLRIPLEDVRSPYPNERSGGLFGHVEPKQWVHRSGEWNKLSIRCEGQRIVTRMNGTELIDTQLSAAPLIAMSRTGYVGLVNWQGQAKGCRFRNISLTSLGDVKGTAPASIPSSFAGVTPGQGKELVPGMNFHWCPKGSFMMGCPVSEQGRSTNEDQISVTLSSGFWLGETEATQGQWQALMQSTPWKGKQYVKEGGEYAASCIIHGDAGNTILMKDSASEFCRRLTEQEHKAGRLPVDWKYALPTEAQWEYACRADTKTKYSFGEEEGRLSNYGWWGGVLGGGNAKSEQYPHQVGLKQANAWGLKDMHGNVWEWCMDWYAEKLPGGPDPVLLSKGSVRVFRGGCWDHYASYCRTAMRLQYSPSYRDDILGFRVAGVPSKETGPAPVVLPLKAATTAPSIQLKMFGDLSLKAGETKSLTVEVTRENCTDEIKLQLLSLPDGVRVIGDPVIPAGLTQGRIEFAADLKAAFSRKPARLVATTTGAVRDSRGGPACIKLGAQHKKLQAERR